MAVFTFFTKESDFREDKKKAYKEMSVSEDEFMSIPLKFWHCFLGAIIKMLLFVKDIIFCFTYLFFLNFAKSADHLKSATYNFAEFFYLLGSAVIDPAKGLIAFLARPIFTLISFFSNSDPKKNEPNTAPATPR